jgi:copper(I)-binding protein
MDRIIALALTLAATPLFAADITVEDAYARASRPGAPTGAMFMTIRNAGDTTDTLIGVGSPVAQIVELHTHIEADGVMRMRPVEGGLEIPAGREHQLARGGDHVMLMGLTQSLVNGETVPLTLIFEKAGEIPLEVTVDNDREQGVGAGN